MTECFDALRLEIARHETNKALQDLGYQPLFAAGAKARIVVIGQAPGIRAQASGLAWDDASGLRLMQWMGIKEETFRDAQKIALIPMDFYYPGKGAHGDLPPRKGFAEKWHPQLLAHMPDVELTILIGAYAQKHYLGKRAERNLTETVRTYEAYLPDYFPLVHPSPLNFRWRKNNPWFEAEVVPELRRRIAQLLDSNDAA